MLIFCTINIKNSPKTAKKATVAFKHGAFFHFVGWDDDIRFPRSPKGVLHPTETISIIYSTSRQGAQAPQNIIQLSFVYSKIITQNKVEKKTQIFCVFNFFMFQRNFQKPPKKVFEQFFIKMSVYKMSKVCHFKILIEVSTALIFVKAIL